jgi:hypothetical protein
MGSSILAIAAGSASTTFNRAICKCATQLLQVANAQLRVLGAASAQRRDCSGCCPEMLASSDRHSGFAPKVNRGKTG